MGAEGRIVVFVWRDAKECSESWRKDQKVLGENVLAQGKGMNPESQPGDVLSS